MSEKIRPHVHTMYDALRNVDTEVVSTEGFVEYLRDRFCLGMGSEAIVLAVSATPTQRRFTEGDEISSNIIRVPFFSHLGRDNTLELLLDYKSQLVKQHHQSEWQIVYQRIIKMTNAEYQAKVQESTINLLHHVASANAQYRRNPGTTIPINHIVCLDSPEQPVATYEKLLQGYKPLFDSEIRPLEQEILAAGGEIAPSNVFLNVSPYEFEGQLLYLHAFHLIDLVRFVPSDESEHVEQIVSD